MVKDLILIFHRVHNKAYILILFSISLNQLRYFWNKKMEDDKNIFELKRYIKKIILKIFVKALSLIILKLISFIKEIFPIFIKAISIFLIILKNL